MICVLFMSLSKKSGQDPGSIYEWFGLLAEWVHLLLPCTSLCLGLRLDTGDNNLVFNESSMTVFGCYNDLELFMVLLGAPRAWLWVDSTLRCINGLMRHIQIRHFFANPLLTFDHQLLMSSFFWPHVQFFLKKGDRSPISRSVGC